MRSEPMYAVYRDDDFEAVGTLDEVADVLGVKPETVKWYASASRRAKRHDRGRYAIRLEEDETR